METDHIFYELFLDHPDWLRELTGVPFPEGCKGSSINLKQLEIRCDLLLTPRDPVVEPHYIVEFQFYHDHSIFNRVELGRQQLWKQLNSREDCRLREYSPREVETVIIFGSQKNLPCSNPRYASEIRMLFMDELLKELAKNHPKSPLLAALKPLSDNLSKLEKNAQIYYDQIWNSPDLEKDDREILNEIFLNILLQRFKTKTSQEIRAMIAELTPIKETRVGQELLEEGIEKGTAELIRKMAAKGKTAEEISDLTDIPVSEIERIVQAILGD